MAIEVKNVVNTNSNFGWKRFMKKGAIPVNNHKYLLDAITSSGILKAKQKLGVTFNFNKQDVIDLTKISKMTMCRASEANSEK